MPFPHAPGFKIKLKPQEPSIMTTDKLKEQLEAVGLNCSQLTEQNLQDYINSVKSEIPQGGLRAYGILAPSRDQGAGLSNNSFGDENPCKTDPNSCDCIEKQLSGAALNAIVPENPVHYAETVGQLVDAATPPWAVVESMVDQEAMQVIQVWDHFKWLYDNSDHNGFPGIVTGPKEYTQYDTNAEAVKKLFSSVMIEMAAAVVKGVDESSMQATVTNIVNEQVRKDPNYVQCGSRVLHLVDGYDSEGRANGIGTLTVIWKLSVQDYKKKSKDGGDKHQTSLTVKAWSVLYSDPDICCKNYNDVLKHFNIDPSSAPTCLH